jgi:hypothetical protein
MAAPSRTDERLDDPFAVLRADIAEIRADLGELRRESQESRRWLMGTFATMVLGLVAILVQLNLQG